MFKKNASFASAMGLFAKAQAELKLAAEQNNAVLKDAQETVSLCEKEAADIDRAAGFLSSILDGKPVEAPAAE